MFRGQCCRFNLQSSTQRVGVLGLGTLLHAESATPAKVAISYDLVAMQRSQG